MFYTVGFGFLILAMLMIISNFLIGMFSIPFARLGFNPLRFITFYTSNSVRCFSLSIMLKHPPINYRRLSDLAYEVVPITSSLQNSLSGIFLTKTKSV
jgi:hypothetical protein